MVWRLASKLIDLLRIGRRVETHVPARGRGPVDHVILCGDSPNPAALRRSFVLCPDNEYDRSPCGTGSSAMTACLAASGTLAEGDEITLESVIGSAYRLSYRPGPTGGVIPRITGQAHVMAEGTLIFDAADPFRSGIA